MIIIMVVVVELEDRLGVEVEVEVEEYQVLALILWMKHSMLTFRCMPTVCSAQHTFFPVIIIYPAQLESPPYGGGRGGRGHARQPSAPISDLHTPNHTPNRGRGRGFRGRGRGHPETNFRNRYSDIGIGASPNVRGRGGGIQRSRLDAPLSRLLYEDRPLLRPIVFVPSTLNPILFDQDEDLLKPGVEEVGTFLFILNINTNW